MIFIFSFCKYRPLPWLGFFQMWSVPGYLDDFNMLLFHTVIRFLPLPLPTVWSAKLLSRICPRSCKYAACLPLCRWNTIKISLPTFTPHLTWLQCSGPRSTYGFLNTPPLPLQCAQSLRPTQPHLTSPLSPEDHTTTFNLRAVSQNYHVFLPPFLPHLFSTPSGLRIQS